jgi:hypothetical protein
MHHPPLFMLLKLLLEQIVSLLPKGRVCRHLFLHFLLLSCQLIID